ncbi:hypothetical protein [Mycolicibacterium hippocampi]|nr:hypothetical protein [Mycolicibacterium hippocampi]
MADIELEQLAKQFGAANYSNTFRDKRRYLSALFPDIARYVPEIV